MRRIRSPMHGVEFPDASKKGNVELRVNLRILTKIGLIGNQIFLVRFVVKPIKHTIVGTTRIRGYLLARKKYLVQFVCLFVCLVLNDLSTLVGH